MIIALWNPAQFTDTRNGFGCACRQVVGIANQKLESLVPGALVAVNRPAQDCMAAQVGAFRCSGPLPGRIDQIANLVHQQGQREVAAAFDRTDQGVSRLYAATLTGHLVEAGSQCAALYERMRRLEEAVPEVVLGHG